MSTPDVIPPEAQQLFAALLDTLGIPIEAGQQVTMHLDGEAQLGMAEFTVRLRKQKPLAPAARAAHTQPRTQPFVGREAPMR